MPTHCWSETFFQALRYSEATEALARYWHDIDRRDGYFCPHRSDFQLTDIAPHLDEIYMSKWLRPGELIVLASGSKLVDMLGEDITGKNIFELTHLREVPDQQIYYNKLRSQPCAGVLTRWGANMSERPFVYRTVQLPLIGDSGEVEFFIGTGVIRSAKKVSDRLSEDTKVNVQHHEYLLLDIGAGLPKT